MTISRQKTHRPQYQYRLPTLFTSSSLSVGFRLSFHIFIAQSLRLFIECLEEDIEEGVKDNASLSLSSVRSLNASFPRLDLLGKLLEPLSELIKRDSEVREAIGLSGRWFRRGG